MDLHDDQLAKSLGRQACWSGELRRMRVELGFSLTEMGAVLGVDASVVSRWERAVTLPKKERAVTLGCLFADLLMLADAGAEKPEVLALV
jgi:transcriptional regulator with XRE-family HTH domain